ncbi:hypothetical protein SAMN05720470_10131 [Fibrobacter sp. UWOV1]|uniref:hypothetical protein n=1 Tax=Fibrobacter sp. UWOV1 TaxID=1896215 RepID=UPI000916E6F6|nr:hypothetical protein [Fibrobacter sp. UWOV1]SHK28342.1 hypothetical protein SAMN05720470_10131 [Fibrobacter sp. UWOV1]
MKQISLKWKTIGEIAKRLVWSYFPQVKSETAIVAACRIYADPTLSDKEACGL